SEALASLFVALAVAAPDVKDDPAAEDEIEKLAARIRRQGPPKPWAERTGAEYLDYAKGWIDRATSVSGMNDRHQSDRNIRKQLSAQLTQEQLDDLTEYRVQREAELRAKYADARAVVAPNDRSRPDERTKEAPPAQSSSPEQDPPDDPRSTPITKSKTKSGRESYLPGLHEWQVAFAKAFHAGGFKKGPRLVGDLLAAQYFNTQTGQCDPGITE